MSLGNLTKAVDNDCGDIGLFFVESVPDSFDFGDSIHVLYTTKPQQYIYICIYICLYVCMFTYRSK